MRIPEKTSIPWNEHNKTGNTVKEQKLCDQVRQIKIKKKLEQAEQDETAREVQTEYHGVVK